MRLPLPLMKMKLAAYGAACTFMLAGCMPGTIATTVGTGYVYEQKQDQKYKHDVERAVDQYQQDHADSPCQHGEDRIMEPAIKIIKEHRLTGVHEVLERLDTIYKDSTQPDNVRAGALYNMAVLESRRKSPNKAKARDHFKQLYAQFPSEYRCIFEESEWRNQMIQKQLLLPGETVDSFLENARRDAERRRMQ
ncbi:hypothetical protein DOQ08_01045 [Marinobacter litoralis]|uniref:Lipoprotein n=1 Tax=Marinobacter litoralis TaxID=187981 RepID=A0A3M2RM35_9GAMM|nr:hypothetical protein [Marinobacter litoralis]RMJ06358.1 hypothetical protein DOQ08_01045 [Marinobacter litoralis]